MVMPRIWRDNIAVTIACAWTIYNLSYLCNAFFYIGLVIYPTAHRAINVALITILVFLLYPLKKGRKKEGLPWYDILAILIIFISCTYIVIKSGKLIYAWSDASSFEMVLGIGCTLGLLEATRRTVNWILPLIIVCFFFTPFTAITSPGFFTARASPIHEPLGGCILAVMASGG